jgi:hypothetical protein
MIPRRVLESHKNASAIALPNQGIRRSAHNAIIIGGGVGVGIGLLFGLVGGITQGPTIGLMVGFTVLLGIGLPFGLGFGGFSFIQHVTLRLILYRARQIPWNYVHFLDYCAERIFLRKVGGGYIFIHRMLMEYFASLDTSEQDRNAPPSR